MSTFAGIVAVAPYSVIGMNGDIPWRTTKEDRKKFKGDMQRFKELTTGHTVLMGRKTYESIGKPLPNRDNVVLSTTMPEQEGIQVVRSVDEAVNSANGNVTWIIGGGKVYEAMLPYMNRIEMTRIYDEFDGDSFFPLLNTTNDWRLAWKLEREDFAFLQYLRR